MNCLFPFTFFQVPITVILYKSTIQHIFLGSVILLVSLNYVNMGCAIDMHVIKETLKRPVGPLVGLVTQFGVMPAVRFAQGIALVVAVVLIVDVRS